MFSNRNITIGSYRFMTDDWGIDSHTLDFTYRLKLNNNYFIQPHLRFYQQSEADFYRYFLRDSKTVPQTVSADYRLGDMKATTIGVKFGREKAGKHVWSTMLEYYLQTRESSPAETFGQITRQDLYPDVETIVVQFNHSFNLGKY